MSVVKKALEEGRDPHLAKAVEMYNIPESQVTKEQRQNAKILNYMDLYGTSGNIAKSLPTKEDINFIAQAKNVTDGFWKFFEK